MATYTTYLHLTKPGLDDEASPTPFNGNMDILDAKINTMESALSVHISEHSGANPALGTIVNGHEYRCTSSSLATHPTFTIGSIEETTSELNATVIFKATNTTAPVISKATEYDLKYSGKDVTGGVFTPVVGTVYRMSIVFDGFYVNIYVAGA